MAEQSKQRKVDAENRQFNKEWTDKQLAVFVRFFNGQEFVDELLSLLPLEGRTSGEDVFKALKTFTDAQYIDLRKLVCISTDGAPAMVGRENGLVAKVKNINPNVIAFHCIMMVR